MDRSPSPVALMFSNVARPFTPGIETRNMIQALEHNVSENTSEASATILVLDDEPCIADLLSEMLRLLGFDPTTCNSPLVALDLLASRQFDVVLSDYRMPQMNGAEFFRRVVTQYPELRSRVVFLTGDTMTEETHQFMSTQGSRYLCKPFDIASVQQIISEIVAQDAA